ncbi:uncharacterized protein LOC114341320 [Diabrotica virgifera virgifera]|uniref:Spermatogenesis-associated protein 17 n=1 Tax=Diabrotica virgifera virgifera TaxID=50390 RepID=A0ABM5L6J9_DIAVI|nr:uncharacterized protein LOC114341320 [Diabrotica virgifera virgifera]
MAHVYQFYEESQHTETVIVHSYKTYNEISNKIHRAAVIIQSFFKGIVVRAQIRRMNAAATVIQRYCRGWLLRYHLPDIMAKVYERMCIKQYNTAAIKIQARWRGYLVRKYKICVKEIIEMRHTAEKANKDIKEQLQRPFSEIGLDEFQCNTKDAQKVFEILFDRHHLLRTQHIEGVLSQTGTQELSELEKLLKLISWKDYIKEIHKIYYKLYVEKRPYRYKFADKRLRKQEDLLRYKNEVEYKYSVKQEKIDLDNLEKEKRFNLNAKIEYEPYERRITASGKYTKPIENITRIIDPSKNVSKTDFNLGVLKDLALKSNIPPYYINFWFEKCTCYEENLCT